MFEVCEIFHVTHVVDDLDAAVSWYERVFGVRQFGRSSPFGAELALLAVADAVFQPMTPVAGATRAGAAQFRQRFGEHLHSLALYVEDDEDLVRSLRERGYFLAGSSGAELSRLPDEIWTRPRETPCLFEFFRRPLSSDPRFQAGWDRDYWRTQHPLGMLGVACLTVAVPDIEAAKTFFVDALGGKVVHESDATPYGTRSTFVALGQSTVMEVAQPVEPESLAAQDLERHGNILHAVTVRVVDTGQAGRHLASNGVAWSEPAPGHLLVEPDQAHGVVFRFTDRELSEW
jgi:catechol 2,3-dioxygenase-like lactoylglutathione lyase family enzyme